MRINKRFLRVILFLTIFSLPYISNANSTIKEKADENIQNKKLLISESKEEDQDINTDEKFNITEFVFEHIKDSHNWHILTTKSGHHVNVPLPIILFSKYSGFQCFLSNKLDNGNIYNNFKLTDDNKIAELNNKGEEITKIKSDNETLYLPLDLSITKNILMMLLSALILLLIFIPIGNSYKKNAASAPKGLQGFLEPIILFVKEDIALVNIGEKKHEKYLPYILTVFFFILIINIMGLIPFFPFGANVSGNIGFTFTLAIFTFLVTTFSGNKKYWKHIFATPGVPLILLPIMVPIEFLSMFTKPFALMIRLFANITAGHIIGLSLISMIFIFKSIYITPAPIAFALFMNVLEVLVVVIQAYVFTLLSALFIGLAVADEH